LIEDFKEISIFPLTFGAIATLINAANDYDSLGLGHPSSIASYATRTTASASPSLLPASTCLPAIVFMIPATADDPDDAHGDPSDLRYQPQPAPLCGRFRKGVSRRWPWYRHYDRHPRFGRQPAWSSPFPLFAIRLYNGFLLDERAARVIEAGGNGLSPSSSIRVRRLRLCRDCRSRGWFAYRMPDRLTHIAAVALDQEEGDKDSWRC